MKMFRNTKFSDPKPWHIKREDDVAVKRSELFKIQSLCENGSMDNHTNDTFLQQPFYDYGNLCKSCINKAYSNELVQIVEY